MLEGENSIYSVGIYIRLSREDDDKVILSESIVNQKSLLLQYVKENNLKVYDIYIDDGYSGTNFNRPGFEKLLRDMKNEKINCIIVKDLSRFARSHIEADMYFENIFPALNIRFISIIENIDSIIIFQNGEINVKFK